ncbi:hypothetical protein L484_022199 [Morus notabilis]|uniref:Uncharacterized protein n=1 Tax=Morus notabilis TaxID=981085 RepID=W9R0A5_9ROSA|nr:hypothetical protein L484_022199 [Morus notabilis]
MEKLKDKRLCRLKYSGLCHPLVIHEKLEPLMSTQMERSSSFSYASSSSSSSTCSSYNENAEKKRRISKKQNVKQTEESLRIIMYLSCWGPN